MSQLLILAISRQRWRVSTIAPGICQHCRYSRSRLEYSRYGAAGLVQGLPGLHKACLWLGIAMDIGAKAGLCMQLRRFALRSHWTWGALVLAFFGLSSLVSLGCVLLLYTSCSNTLCHA